MIWRQCAVGALWLACLASVTPSSAQDVYAMQQGPMQPDDCVTQAANYHGVNGWILRAIIQVESNFNPNATNRNQNGTTDIGIAQINSMHLKELSRHGVTPRDLMDACKATYVAAWHLRKQVRAYGNTWYAVGAYHSTTPCYNNRYIALVWNAMLKWGAVNGQKAHVPSMASCGATKSPGTSTASSTVMDSAKTAPRIGPSLFAAAAVLNE